MKRNVILPAIILMGIMLACFSSKASTPSLDPDGETPGVLHFTFLFPMGDVTITLAETTAGIVSSDEYSTSLELVTIPVPAQGSYDVSIVVSIIGVENTGSFVL